MPQLDLHSSFNRALVFLRKQNWFLFAMLSLILLLTAYLVFATKPWDPELDFSASAKSSLRVHSYVVDGLWWGALINLFIVSICLFASRFYPRSNATSPDLEDEDQSAWKSLSPWQSRSILSLSLVAVALSAYLNAPRLNHSLWGDEEATARRFIVGHVNRQDNGSLKWHKAKWGKTIWSFDNGPNNHVLFSILGRLSHSFAKPENGPDDYYFSETWIRLPAFLAGLGAVASIAWLMVVMGFPKSAPFAAFTLALHPWFVRWGTDARGYALELLFIPLILVFLLKALQAKQNKTSWAWWASYGFTEFLLIYSHLGAVYFLFPLNIAAFILAWSPSRHQDYPLNPFRQKKIWQCAAANALGAVLTIQLLGPCLKPMLIWLGKSRAAGDITMPWMENWISYFASGMPWNPWDASNPYCITLPDFLKEQPLLGGSSLLLTGLLLLAGFVALLKKRQQRYLLLPLLAPGLLTVLHAKLGGNLLYPWYMVGFLPLCVIVVSVGLDRISRLISKRRAYAPLAISFCLLFALLTQQQRQLYREHPVEALAHSVRLTRKVINPFDANIDEVITLDVVHATRLYDPAHLRVRSLEEFVAALKLADSTNRPLYLNLANPGLLGRDLPIIGQMIEDRKLFQAPTLIHGLQNPCTRYILRYIPHSVDKFALPSNS